MNQHNASFKWLRTMSRGSSCCGVSWYLRYQLSYRDMEEMMKERGLTVDYTAVWRWAQKYHPEINKVINYLTQMLVIGPAINQPIWTIGLEKFISTAWSR